MQTYHNCFDPITYTASSLHNLINDDTLYYDYMQSTDSTSPDYWMLQQYGLAGYLTGYALDPESRPILPNDKLRFTGTIYERISSVPEKIFGTGEDRLFYEVSVDNSRLLMPTFMFPDPPLPLCNITHETSPSR